MIKKPNAVWVDEFACKGCNICVSYCPSGTIAMRYEPTSVQGVVVEILDESSCIGCKKCELYCPDFAIFVASDGYKFAKLTDKSKQIAKAIKDNKFMRI